MTFLNFFYTNHAIFELWLFIGLIRCLIGVCIFLLILHNNDLENIYVFIDKNNLYEAVNSHEYPSDIQWNQMGWICCHKFFGLTKCEDTHITRLQDQDKTNAALITYLYHPHTHTHTLLTKTHTRANTPNTHTHLFLYFAYKTPRRTVATRLFDSTLFSLTAHISSNRFLLCENSVFI